jgi:lipoyl(octanoyl) transferase
LVAALEQEGIAARARPEDGPDFTGVWVEDRKIASIGVHVARGVATHGFAVNVENDLQPFSFIVPCGLDGVQMTSMINETDQLAGVIKCFRRRAAFQLAETLGRRQRLVSMARLEAAVGAGAQAAGLLPAGAGAAGLVRRRRESGGRPTASVASGPTPRSGLARC